MLVVLALVVAGREIPEYLTLTDDVSNDGEEAIVLPDCSQALCVLRQPGQPGTAATLPRRIEAGAVAGTTEAFEAAGRDRVVHFRPLRT